MKEWQNRKIENGHTRGFGVAELESGIRIIKFKRADPIWRMISKSFRILNSIITFNVLPSLITILIIYFKNSKWRIQFGGWSQKVSEFWFQIITFNVLPSLITILIMYFKNSKWRIQYGGWFFFNSSDIFSKFLSESLRGWWLRIWNQIYKNSKWRIQYGGWFFLKSSDIFSKFLSESLRGRWLRIWNQI